MQQALSTASITLSLVLVAVTIWYAWQTQQMVREMRAARTASVRPNVRLDLDVVGRVASVRVENVGVGPATNVAIDLAVDSTAGHLQTAHWTAPMLRDGESQSLILPTGKDGLMTLAALSSDDVKVTMVGKCTDLDGRIHPIRDQLCFALVDCSCQGRWETSKDRWPRTLEAIAGEIEGIRRAIEPHE